MAQVQCPNCGGYRVETETKTIDRKTNTAFDFGCGFWLILGLPATMGTLIGIVGWYGFLFMGEPLTDGGWIMLCMLPVGLFCLVLMIRYIKSYFSADTVDVYHNTCLLCGYKWSRRADEPLPEVTLRPDLIARGKQRLQEEEENLRRMAAADYWLRQQRK